MAVTTTKTNKPLNPRGNDQSPKGYNRAELYTGKALDFDGVNDDIQISSFSTTGSTRSLSYYFKSSVSDNERVLEIRSGSNYFNSTILNGKINTYDGSNGINTTKTFNDNKWHHVVITHNGNNNAAIYVDGVSQELDASTFSVHDITNQTLYICSASGSAQFYDGGLSNLRLFDVALTAAQVADLYNNPEKIVPTGVADSALKLWLPMMEGAGTTCINGAPDAIGSDLITNGDFATDSKWTKGTGWSIGSGVASCDGTQTGNTTLVQQNGVQGVSLSIEDGELYELSFDTSNITAGALTYFEVGGGIEYTDVNTNGSHKIYLKATGTNNRLTIAANSAFVGSVDNVTLKKISNTGAISGATWTHGIGAPVSQTAVINWNKQRVNNTDDVLIPQGLTAGRDLLGNLFENVRKQGALNLDGNSWAEVHKNDSIPEGDEGRTLECWFFGVDKGATQSYMETGNNSANNKRFGILTISSDNIYIVGQGYDTDTGVAMDLDAWNHVAVTHDGSTLKVYKNGSLIKTVTGRTYATANDDVVIGRNGSTGGEDSFGAIAQPRIYNRALNASEIERNYNAGKNIYK